MTTLRATRRLLDFDDWANGPVVRALASLETTAPTAVAGMAHVTAAKRLWFARVTQGIGGILTHLALHGQHHRGQCLTAIRRAGGTPPVIDFIHASRAGVI